MPQTTALPETKRFTPDHLRRMARSQRSTGPSECLRAPESRQDELSDTVAETVGGVGQGLYDVGEGAVAGVRAALTTNPATTVRSGSRRIARHRRHRDRNREYASSFSHRARG